MPHGTNTTRHRRRRKVPPELGPPPRVDLRLEALAGILDGSIKIHSHCYRSDEILMLLRTAQKYGVRVQSLQHVLEGYKVAAEIAAHGASASTFSDWWAYKIEAYDAIPHNAALLTEAGASVCIKSDDAELMRHLNLEAAKMVKYGGVSESQALAMITINPARELGLDGRLGSIEVGKDADIAIFNGHPFDAFSRCELALIDGEVYLPAARARRGVRRPSGRAHGDAGGARVGAKPLDRNRRAAQEPLRPGRRQPAPGLGAGNQGGTLVIAGGKIAAIGPAGTPIPPEAQTIEMSGLDIWPGMVDAGSTIGLFEIGSLTETQDSADAAQFQPELRSSTALHPDSEHIPVTRANGILTSFVEPTGGTISGQGCLIDLNGWVPRELVIADQVALNVTIPTYIPRTPESRSPARPRAARPRARWRSGSERGTRAAQGTARKDQGTVPQGHRLRHGRHQGTRPRRSSPRPRCPAGGPRSLRPRPEAGDPARRAAGRDPGCARDHPRAQAQGGDLGGVRSLESGRCAQAGQGAGAGRRHAQTAPGTTMIRTTRSTPTRPSCTRPA